MLNIRDTLNLRVREAPKIGKKPPRHFSPSSPALKFTALPFRNQTMYVNESCQFCSTRALYWKLQRALEYLV